MEEKVQAQPLISIIIPVYNVKIYLELCMESVLSQTYRNIEVILVDDGSTDGSGLQCDHIAEEDSRVNVIHKENGGLSDARNVGIEIAMGEYVTFIDSDDFIHKKYIELLYNIVANYSADIAIAGYRKFCDEEEISPIKLNVASPKEVYTPEGIMKHFFDGYAVQVTSAWGKLYRKEYFKDIKYPCGLINEDEFITYKLYDKAEKIVLADYPLYYYRQRKGSILHSKFTEKNFAVLDAYKERLEFISEKYPLLLTEAAKHYAETLIRFYSLSEINNVGDKKKIKHEFDRVYEQYLRTENGLDKRSIKCMLFKISPRLYNVLRGKR